MARSIYAIRVRGWQIDYRPDGWLPLSIRSGKREWHTLRLGRLGCITFGRLLPPVAPPPPCLGSPNCALTLGFQWCTCHSPAGRDEKSTPSAS